MHGSLICGCPRLTAGADNQKFLAVGRVCCRLDGMDMHDGPVGPCQEIANANRRQGGTSGDQYAHGVGGQVVGIFHGG